MRASRSIHEIVNARWAFSIDDAAAILKDVGEVPKVDLADYPELILAGGEDPQAAALTWHLNNTAVDLRWKERQQTMPTPAQVQKRAARIAKLAQLLHTEIADEKGEVYDGLSSGGLYAFAAIDDGQEGKLAVQKALSEVRRLHRWAEGLEARSGREAARKPSKVGRKRDDAFHELIDRLGAIYFHVWQRRPGLSRDPLTAEPHGPYFRFVQSVVRKLLPRSKTDEAIATTLGNHRWPQWDEWLKP